jgi:hypothetical protein
MKTPYGANCAVSPQQDVDKGVSPETIRQIADRMDDDAPATPVPDMPDDLHKKCKAMLSQMPEDAAELPIQGPQEYKPPSREDIIQKYLDQGYEVVNPTGGSRF